MTAPGLPSDGAAPVPMLDGFAVRVGGRIVAWFADPEDAGDWATDTHFGQWLMHPCRLPDAPPFTPEQIAAARLKAESLMSLLTDE